MEPEVHIVQRYLELIKGCFTMTNIALTGGKELDILAVDPRSNNRYHVEVRIATGRGFKIRLVDTQTRDGRKHKRGLDTLNAEKFSPPEVVEACKRIFGSSEYERILVVWDVQEPSVIEQAMKLYQIEVWRISDIITELMQKVGTKPYRDDILRLAQLISAAK